MAQISAVRGNKPEANEKPLAEPPLAECACLPSASTEAIEGQRGRRRMFTFALLLPTNRPACITAVGSLFNRMLATVAE